MASLKDRVVRLLRTRAYVKHIDVRTGVHRLMTDNLDFIAGLIKLGKVPVSVGTLSGGALAEYRGRGAGAPNSITFDRSVVSGDETLLACVAVHEATHAHQDWLRLKLTAVESERAAHIAQAMCLLNVTGGAEHVRGTGVIQEATRVARQMRQGGTGLGDFHALDALLRRRYGSGARVYNGIRLL